MKPTLQISPAEPARSWKQHTLHTTAEEIERALGFPANVPATDHKGAEWSFQVEDHPGTFAIWAWNDSDELRGEWSAFGDGAVFDLLFPGKP